MCIDGRTIVSASHDKTLKIWRRAVEEGSRDRNVTKLWNDGIEEDEREKFKHDPCLRTLTGHADAVLSVCISYGTLIVRVRVSWTDKRIVCGRVCVFDLEGQ